MPERPPVSTANGTAHKDYSNKVSDEEAGHLLSIVKSVSSDTSTGNSECHLYCTE